MDGDLTATLTDESVGNSKRQWAARYTSPWAPLELLMPDATRLRTTRMAVVDLSLIDAGSGIVSERYEILREERNERLLVLRVQNVVLKRSETTTVCLREAHPHLARLVRSWRFPPRMEQLRAELWPPGLATHIELSSEVLRDEDPSEGDPFSAISEYARVRTLEQPTDQDRLGDVRLREALETFLAVPLTGPVEAIEASSTDAHYAAPTFLCRRLRYRQIIDREDYDWWLETPEREDEGDPGRDGVFRLWSPEVAPGTLGRGVHLELGMHPDGRATFVETRVLDDLEIVDAANHPLTTEQLGQVLDALRSVDRDASGITVATTSSSCPEALRRWSLFFHGAEGWWRVDAGDGKARDWRGFFERGVLVARPVEAGRGGGPQIGGPRAGPGVRLVIQGSSSASE